jgi:hypothetical protein
MTINYPDGTTLKALLLMHGNDTLQAAVPGDDDARTFTIANGTWITEECEPVTIEFAWQRREKAQVPNETECVCPTDLASRLISALHAGTKGDRLIEKHVVCVFSC